MLASDPAQLTRLSTLDPWVGANVERLAEIEISSDGAGAGLTLAHSDIRADNILLTDDAVLFVDWPHAAIGARWLDLLYLLPSVAMQGGPDPHRIFWNHPVAYDAVPEAVLSVLTGFAGFMIHGATQPPPAGLPTLREFQLAQGIEAIRWIRQMMR
jgi:hypothetical protein